MSVLRWTDELHQAWKNKRAAQLARELDRQSNTREDGAQYGQRVAAGGLPENPREVPKGSDRPPQSSGASSTYAASAKAPAGGESPSSVGHVQGAKADGGTVQAAERRAPTAVAAAASSLPIQRASHDPTQSRVGAYRGVASAARAPILERDVLAAVLELLQAHPRVAWAERMNAGGVERENANGSTRYIRFAFKGCSDIIGQLRDGRFLAIEVKRPGGKPTDDQVAFLGRVTRGNGVAFVAWSVDDVMRGLA